MVGWMIFWKAPAKNAGTVDTAHPVQKDMVLNSGSFEKIDETDKADVGSSEEMPEEEPSVLEHTGLSMEDALFIGDSRTVGLSEYAGIEGADFFADIGMSVYNIQKKTVSVPAAGKVTIAQLLQSRKYHKIYLMLGVNELGYRFDDVIDHYKELVGFIREQQPDAVVFIMANLHVSKSRSDNDKVINNEAINKLNAALAAIADNRDVFYLDANVLFDDESGNLSSDMTEDDAHLYGKYYIKWGRWLIDQTALHV